MVCLFDSEQETESFSRYIHGLDVAVKNLSSVISDQVKKWQTLYKREYQRIGHSFIAYGQAFGMEEQIGKLIVRVSFWPDLMLTNLFRVFSSSRYGRY